MLHVIVKILIVFSDNMLFITLNATKRNVNVTELKYKIMILPIALIVVYCYIVYAELVIFKLV